MKASEAKTNTIDYYYSLLRNLSSNDKLDLIARLSNSMKTDKEQKEDKSWKSLFGVLDLDESAEEFVQRLENERNFNRKQIDL